MLSRLLAILLLFAAVPALAVPTFYTDEALFQTAAGGRSNLAIDQFDSLSSSFSNTNYDGSVDATPSTGLNVAANTLAGNMVDDSTSNYCQTGSCLRITGGTGKQWDFSFDQGAVYAFGFWLGDFATVGTSTLTLFTDSGSSSSFTVPDQPRFTNRFYGITESTTAFIRASLTASDSGDIIGIDNVQWGGQKAVGEPGTLLLLGIGILGLAVISRRRKKQS